MLLRLYTDGPRGAILLRVRLYGFPPAQPTAASFAANADYQAHRDRTPTTAMAAVA